MRKHFQCNCNLFWVRSFWAACADLVSTKNLLNGETMASEITKKNNSERAHLCLWFNSQIYCYAATLGHSECALLFASGWALSQGVILPERQKTLSAQRSCIFPTHFLIHFVNCLSPPLSLCYVSCELHWKSVCDRHFQYLVSCQTSMRWKTSNMALGSQTHTHTRT